MFKILIILFINQTHAEFNFSLDTIFTAQKNKVSENSMNPMNHILQRPEQELSLDFRADFKWKFDQSKIVLRPRFTSINQKMNDELTNKDLSKSINDMDITDAFIETQWTPNYSTTVGLQVYQWGPSEFINASNPLFHFNSNQKNLYFKEKGQVMIRQNLTLNQENNFVLSIVPISNNEPEWIADDEFVTKAYLKYEKSSLVSADILGIVIGTKEKNKFYFAEYFNMSFLEKFVLYADLIHSKNNSYLEPVLTQQGYDLEYYETDSNSWSSLADLGLRYEDEVDFRFEFVYNESGFNQENLKKVIQSASNQRSINYSSNLKKFLKPGLELLGKQYLYISIRWSEAFKIKDMGFSSRILYSLQDQSSQLQAEFDRGAFDHFNFFSNFSFTTGSDNSEMRLQNDYSLLIGLKYSL